MTVTVRDALDALLVIRNCRQTIVVHPDEVDTVQRDLQGRGHDGLFNVVGSDLIDRGRPLLLDSKNAVDQKVARRR